MKRIKNNDIVEKVVLGMTIQPGEYYTIQAVEDYIWSNNSQILSDIVNGSLIMNDGNIDILDINSAINLLKDGNPKEVITQFEKDDKNLRMASIQGDVDENGEVILELKIPGVFSNGDGRYVDAGVAWFDSQHKDDRIIEAYIVDKDNILGYGANTPLGYYHDLELLEENQGWRIPPKRGLIEVTSIAGYGFIPAQLYLCIKGKKGGDLTTGTLYINLKWGKAS